MTGQRLTTVLSSWKLDFHSETVVSAKKKNSGRTGINEFDIFLMTVYILLYIDNK